MSTNRENRNQLSFEDFKNRDHISYWWATDLSKMMGYEDMDSFAPVLENTRKIFAALHIPYYENIAAEQRTIDGTTLQDYRLSRFACYIAVMNGDPSKTRVAEAQAYFAEQTRRFELFIEKSSDIERLAIRQQLADANKALSSIAKDAGVTNYSKFQNAGYLGLYNCEAWKLAKNRKLKRGTLLEHMGRAELAANLFRVTQTEAKIKHKHITGQPNLEQAHFDVGRQVRGIVIENSGTVPEKHPVERTIEEVKSHLKQGHDLMRESED